MRRFRQLGIAAASASVVLLLVAAVGQAGGPPSIGWSPSDSGSFGYGLVAVGHTSSQTFTLSNSGGSASAALTVELSGSPSFAITEDLCTGTSIGPNKSCTVTVEYAPTVSGASSATLTANGKKVQATTSQTLTGSSALLFKASGPAVDGLSPLNENPAHPTSSATGTAEVWWDTSTDMMTVNVAFSGLSGPNTAAHIHCCVTTAGGNAGVATVTPTFTGFPAGVTSGTYTHTFDMTLASSYNPAFVTLQGSLANAKAALLAGLQAGTTYLNIHSTTFGGGEERGFLHAA
jgi:hypothetical protein